MQLKYSCCNSFKRQNDALIAYKGKIAASSDIYAMWKTKGIAS